MKPRILLIDIETAPNRVYTWGLFKQNIAINQIDEPGYTLCFAYKWLGEKKVSFSSIYHDGKENMIEEAHRLLDEADAVIHYNGTKFDIPVLNSEFVASGLNPPSPATNIDLLNTVRRRFRLTSNKLDFVSGYLGLGNKVAHKGMDLWRKCMAGNKQSWKTMQEYNIQDVNLLEKLYGKLLPWITNHPNLALFATGNGNPVCPNCGGHHLQRRGTYYTAALTYQRFQCQDCGTWSRARKTDLDKDKRETVLRRTP